MTPNDVSDLLDEPAARLGNIVIAEDTGENLRIKASNYWLRQIIFGIGDVVWPGWYDHEKGHSLYIGYYDTAVENGCVVIGGNRVFTAAWDVVRKRIELLGAYVLEVS